jgi:hypothetical protein
VVFAEANHVSNLLEVPVKVLLHLFLPVHVVRCLVAPQYQFSDARDGVHLSWRRLAIEPLALVRLLLAIGTAFA